MSVRVFHDREVGEVLLVKRTQRARIEHTCADCKLPIAKGEVHVYAWSVVDHDGSSASRYHLGECCEYLP